MNNQRENLEKLIEKGAGISHQISILLHRFAHYLLEEMAIDPRLVISLLTASLLTPVVGLGKTFPEKLRRSFYEVFIEVLKDERERIKGG